MRPKSSSFKTGQQIGRYELVQLLGRGGNADVWKARDQNGSPMALKLLCKLDVSSEPYKRFTREVAELRQLGAFPGVLPLQ
jgi:serine/threonine protein kinase